MLNRINAYRVMWVFVYFDLPTLTKKDRKAYRVFKNSLDKNGYSMLQYSIYVRHCQSREDAQKHIRRIKSILPLEGHVIIHMVTDKQYSMMDIFFNCTKINKPKEEHGQLVMF